MLQWKVLQGSLIAAFILAASPSHATTSPPEAVIHSFSVLSKGRGPQSLVADASGAYYGVAVGGGDYGFGVVFKLTPSTQKHPAWSEAGIYSFKAGADGAAPEGTLFVEANGTLVGTTSNGGGSTVCADGCGTVFRLTPPPNGGTAWTETVLYSFTGGADGTYPSAGLITDATGAFYGTTVGGGRDNLGTVFKLTPPGKGETAWTEIPIYQFGANAQNPSSTLLADATGGFYGTTVDTVFRLTPPEMGKQAWTETVLHRFKNDGVDATSIFGGVVADAHGALYGAGAFGGKDNAGTVFRLTPPAKADGVWTETLLHVFTGGADGGEPASPIIDASGALYGTTGGGGKANDGTVFKLTRPTTGDGPWTETTLYQFHGSDGVGPFAGVVADASGALYGTTTEGGGQLGNGVVFKLTPPATENTAWTETVLTRFPGSVDGAGPTAALIANASGALYGATSGGGLYSGGTVFELMPPEKNQTVWRETILYDFGGNSADGDGPGAPLIVDAHGNLYGTTYSGGVSDNGTVFELTPPAKGQTAWTESVLYRFKGGTAGSSPLTGVVIDAHGSLYGAVDGGQYNYGLIFKLTPPAKAGAAWTETVLHHFTGGTDGVGPTALAIDAAGNLFGMTGVSGQYDGGTAFELSPPAQGKNAWRDTLLHSFGLNRDGSTPGAALVVGSGGVLYGTTINGGGSGVCPAGCGAVFKLVPPGNGETGWTETVLHGFQGGVDGVGPNAAVFLRADGTIYGTTGRGGRYDDGTAFELTTSDEEVVLHSFKGGTDGAGPNTPMVIGADGLLYGTTEGGGRGVAGTVFKLTP